MSDIELIENDNENVTEISRYSFNSFAIERSIRDLISWHDRKKVEIPEFQRKFVWDFDKCCKFIESVLLNLPIPNMFLFRDRTEVDERYILVDGLQRFTCIKQFIDGTYINGNKRKKFKINIKNSKWYNCSYEDLNDDDKESFGDYSIKINVFDSSDNKNDDIKKLYMIEIFERINTGSEKLTDQEIRNAVYSSRATNSLKEASQNEKLIKLLSFSPKYTDNRCYDQEFILRVLTYYRIYRQLVSNSEYLFNNCKITSSKKMMLSEYLYYSSKDEIDINEDLKIFNYAIDKIYNFSTDCFKTIDKDKTGLGKTVHEVMAESICISVMLGNDFKVTPNEYNLKKIQYWRETNNNDNPFYSSTTNQERILKRIEVMKSFMEN